MDFKLFIFKILLNFHRFKQENKLFTVVKSWSSNQPCFDITNQFPPCILAKDIYFKCTGIIIVKMSVFIYHWIGFKFRYRLIIKINNLFWTEFQSVKIITYYSLKWYRFFYIFVGRGAKIDLRTQKANLYSGTMYNLGGSIRKPLHRMSCILKRSGKIDVLL